MKPRFDLIVRGGAVLREAVAARADIGIGDGRIVAIEERLEDAAQLIEASGRLVLPGGVDSHCHMDQPAYGGAACADDFESATIAAACGGTTTVMPFAMAEPTGVSLSVTVARYQSLAEGHALVDYGIHPTVQATPPDVLVHDLPLLIRTGYGSLKAFTTYTGFRLDDESMIGLMQVAAREGALLMIHAESDAMIAALTRDLVAHGLKDPRFLSKARPPAAEREAIGRMAAFAEVTGAEILIVHVSSREGLLEIDAARRRGVRIHAETCPHYLLLDESALEQPAVEAAKYTCAPPLRRSADQTALWSAMAQGGIDILSSDHSPCRLHGADGKFRAGPFSRFDQIAGGIPGLELRLPLIFSEGYLKGRISLGQFAALSAGRPAALHRIAPQKGAIALGADADLALWDPSRETTITHDRLHGRVDYTPYQGRRIRGWPVTTIARGEIIVDEGRLLGKPGRGRFVASAARTAP
jgi:dihydropyrimidinase